MSTKNFLFAGFGGQGILFAGKLLAYSGLLKGKQVSWLPSYGPEMRGGTANCSVIISDEQIGSPIVAEPDILVALNLPSLEKYQNKTQKGGMIVYDNSIITKSVSKDDVKVFAIPATQLAIDNKLDGLANMIILGKVIKECDAIDYDYIKQAMQKVVSAKKANLLEYNLKAIEIGYNYK
ncbi:MAG: 2-oxoacid:ferredoxin oxidoreductase subunit gamma [Clostridiales bacterium]|nr:2-oxoacid:ferredoxin oxidoreductase subunit gamma [Clostridiales bacterium]